jgi:xanthine dehydrogenase YagR molybdenum-binding subunit
MNPLQIESQVQGGILQGISYALFEERILDRHTGHMLNANLEQYKILRSRETPAIEVHLLENYQGMSATDAYGIAEPSNIATAPAIANAVYNAIGVRLRQLPMSPAAVLAALGRIPQRSGPT